MDKKLVIILVVLVVLVVGVGAFLFLGNGFNLGNLGGNKTNPNNFEIEGMKVEILKQGSGVAAKNGDIVTAHYSGTLEDGKEFDSSIKRNVPFSFQLGKETVIKGWDLGVPGMKVGEVRRLTIPYELGYGADGFPPTIPQKATLIYTIEVLGISAPTGQ